MARWWEPSVCCSQCSARTTSMQSTPIFPCTIIGAQRESLRCADEQGTVCLCSFFAGCQLKRFLWVAWLGAVSLTPVGCSWLMPWPARYLAQATGSATQEQVAQQLEPPHVERSLDDGETVWEYRYTGVSSPMLLPITEVWCVEYRLVFDQQTVLRHWLRKDCSQLLDINSASADDLKRSEEHTSELQSPDQLVCRLLLEKKNT